jgi:exopolyphosphatase/guanosine-5'-triphosphate,3'-diphosphate pyrophosphatase
LRVADSFDRSHRQPVHRLELQVERRVVRVGLVAKRAVDLEIWDAEHEAPLFQRVFGRKLEVKAAPAGPATKRRAAPAKRAPKRVSQKG